MLVDFMFSFDKYFAKPLKYSKKVCLKRKLKLKAKDFLYFILRYQIGKYKDSKWLIAKNRNITSLNPVFERI